MRVTSVLRTLAALAALAFVTTAHAQQAIAPSASVNLDQGWSASDRERWYGASQGSRLIPLAWFKALEQPDGAGLFLDDAHIASLRYLPRPGNLPVGFAVDIRDDRALGATRLRWRAAQSDREPWVGFTCSACHTAELRYQDRVLRVDGGPTLADYQAFIESFNRALTLTRDDPARYERFAKRLLGPEPTARDRALLKRALSDLVIYQNAIAAMNETPLRYGHGRLDAVGYILNKVSFAANRAAPTANPPDAPVSYPFIWNTHQQRHVQWNGIAENKPRGGVQSFDVGALGRNVGEVIGVFADVRPAGFMQIGATSSADVKNLIALEQQLERLRPPRWPRDVLGVPDEALIASGRALFARRCTVCHMPLAREDLKSRPVDRLTRFTFADFGNEKPGTDIWMACNTATNEARTGLLRGAETKLVRGRPLGEVEPAAEMLRVLVTQSLTGQTAAVSQSAVASWIGFHQRPLVMNGDPKTFGVSGPSADVAKRKPGSYTRAERRQRCINGLANPDIAPLLAYKARPLTGVWATPPYLHNGSVPSLYEVLLPPAERSTSFHVGTRRFDPVDVGYETDAAPDNPFAFRVRDEAGGLIEGNSNAGHDYDNASLTEADRRALVEYLKVIGE